MTNNIINFTQERGYNLKAILKDDLRLFFKYIEYQQGHFQKINNVIQIDLEHLYHIEIDLEEKILETKKQAIYSKSELENIEYILKKIKELQRMEMPFFYLYLKN